MSSYCNPERARLLKVFNARVPDTYFCLHISPVPLEMHTFVSVGALCVRCATQIRNFRKEKKYGPSTVHERVCTCERTYSHFLVLPSTTETRYLKYSKVVAFHLQQTIRNMGNQTSKQAYRKVTAIISFKKMSFSDTKGLSVVYRVSQVDIPWGITQRVSGSEQHDIRDNCTE